MRLTLLFAGLLACVACAYASELQVIDDFEHGVSRWYLVEGNKAQGDPPLGVMAGTSDAKVGRGAARLRYVACPGTWTHYQYNISTLDWIANDCDRVSLWIKGDGSGETLNVMFGNYERKPALCFTYPVKLDFTGWRQVVIPFADFNPKGQMGAHVGELVLAQFDVNGTQKPVDVTIDELVALPADRGQKQRFFDLVAPAEAVWDKPSPTEPIAVDNLLGIAPGTFVNGMIHGVRNHLDLHKPISFAVQYPGAGTFGVKITKTSGYGGSRLLIKIDGQEALRKDFPGTTETTLTEYQGYYGVPVPAGKHVLTVDNDGADWFTVEAYCFGNLRCGNARLRREDGRLEAALMSPEGTALKGLAVSADVAGKAVTLTQQPEGLWLSDSLWGGFPQGNYPIVVTAQQQGKAIFAADLTASLGSAHLRPIKTTFDKAADVNLDLLYVSETDVPLEGQKLVATVGGKQYACTQQEPGVYRAALGKLPEGPYHARVETGDGRSFEAPFIVYDPAGKPWAKEGLIGLGDNGRFMTATGKTHVPWGFATIGLFAPDPELIDRFSGPSQWCRASDEDILNWIGLLASYGINCVRFGVTVDGRSICGDKGGHADPWMIERLHHFLDLIGPLGVRAIPVMWWGHYRNFGYQGIPAYDALIDKQADWFTKPEALALQQQYVREVVTSFANDPRILAWEVMNETYKAGDDLQASIKWTNSIIKTMRECSPGHMVTTSAAEATPGPELEWTNGTDLDFFNYHEYPTYPNYSQTNKLLGDAPHEIGDYAAVMTLCDRLGQHVVMLGEAGNDRLQEASYPELRQLITRDCLWLSFLHGSPGGISWDAIADPREFGVLSQISKGIDWTRFRPAATPVVVEVADADAQMANLARYVWWSLEHGVPISFIRADQVAAAGQMVLSGDSFSPPEKAPAATVQVGPGLQATALQSADGKVFIGYIRNVSGRTIINTRVRKPVSVSITLRPRKPGTFQVWDLDSRTVVKRVEVGAETALDLGETAHDFAVVRVSD